MTPEETVIQLKEIAHKANIGETYKSYINFVAWKIEKDGYSKSTRTGRKDGQKREKKEKKA
jgi:hypothetical protein